MSKPLLHVSGWIYYIFYLHGQNLLGENMEKKMLAALNKQINAELYSAYLYLSMSAYFESVSLSGCAHWMRAQASEEQAHAMKFYKFINERRERVEFTAIEAPKHEWRSILEVFTDAFMHEQKVTKMIDALMVIALETKDYATQSFLKWFIDEQVEEEAHADMIVQKFKMIGDNQAVLLALDQELGKRE